MFARIYQPAPSTTTSGRANTHKWVIEFDNKRPLVIDPLTGTTRSTNTLSQLELEFDTVEDAVAYAKANNIPHRVEKPKVTKRVSRSYAENFAYDRKHPWTH
ncbi:ETC complex I subunit [Fretibacter rubidus]|uniref:ETC complex I subunit n=1 Tax=Fretibacter rubidus TaxID=570162 RepID=UPI00352A501B